jgi:RNA polymerase sigma-70 factor (ECF subfamily)
MSAGVDYSDEGALVDALSAGDEQAFAWLLDRYDGSLRRAARMYVASAATADEVVQETWVAVIRGLPRFERRSSLKTWLYRILMNIARTHGVREHRSVPFSSAPAAMREGDEPAVDPDRFRPLDDQYPRGWRSFPPAWEQLPEQQLLSGELLDQVGKALETLPAAQREVVTLRDLEGWSAAEVCNALAISETNQRVLLHRGRMKLRRVCEEYLEPSPL